MREKALILNPSITPLFHVEEEFAPSFQTQLEHRTGGFGQYLNHVLPPAIPTKELIDPILVHASYLVNPCFRRSSRSLV
jgi:hypothetical protein